MPRVLKLLRFFGISAFTLGAAGYLVLRPSPGGGVFGALPRMFLYHEAHPFQYIGIVAISYAIVATAVVVQWPHLSRRRQHLAIMAIVCASIIVASVPGGVLWKIHDMQAGFFTEGARFWKDLLWGALAGLQTGWLIILLSLPYNILGFAIGYALTFYGFKIGAGPSQSVGH